MFGNARRVLKYLFFVAVICQVSIYVSFSYYGTATKLHHYIVRNVDFLRLKHPLERDEAIPCVVSEPKLNADEILLSYSTRSDRHTCLSNLTPSTGTFDVNFNIERIFKFDFVPKDESSTRTAHDTSTQDADGDHGIQKNLHFIWNDMFIPDPFVNNLKKFRKLHPNWTIYFWTLSGGREFIKKNEPNILTTFDNYAQNVSRADALRYVVMYYFGGAYFDLDCEPRLPLDNLTNIANCLIGPEPIENSFFVTGLRSLLSTAAFMCKAKHAFLRHLIDSLPAEKERKDIMQAAGPVYMTRRMNSYLAKELYSRDAFGKPRFGEIKVLKHDFFEFAPHKFVSGFMASKHCKNVMTNVTWYIHNCYKVKQQQSCTDLLRNKSKRDLTLFDACLEWVLHGGMNRTSSSARYVTHTHFGTYNNKTVFKVRSVYIPQIVPGVVIF